MNLDSSARQPPHIAHVLQVVRKDDHGERTSDLFFAEVEVVNPLVADLYAENFPGDTSGFADVLAGVVNGDAVGGTQEWAREQ
jgi:hypothetical protein